MENNVHQSHSRITSGDELKYWNETGGLARTGHLTTLPGPAYQLAYWI
jgi:hypothetical protein